ncbi:hypothetical protein [Psychroserpens algicola]|uniref:hypothetical protein n=1 Tax=Psychroserpens algicola TaxID=1719034 RepID=UPI001954B013|nr:hypothetical protein [Psychroserpens algicola]
MPLTLKAYPLILIIKSNKMKTNINYLIRLTLICVMLFSSCQKDDDMIEESNVSNKMKFKIDTYELINYTTINDYKVKQKVDLLNSTRIDKGKFGIAKNNQHEIIIDTTSVKFVSTDMGYESYTFNVLNSEEGNYIENIVVSRYPNDSIQTVLVTHHLSHPLNDINLNELDSNISYTTYDIIDDTTNVVQSKSSNYSCVTVTVTIMVDKCKGENQGADTCNDENGQPLQVPHTMIIAEACGFNGGGGSSGANTGSAPGDPGGNGTTTGGNVDVSNLPEDFIITTPNVNIVNVLKQTFGLSDFDQDDIELINYMNNNYSPFEIEGFENITEKAYFYLLNSSFTEASINFMYSSLILMMTDSSVSFTDIMNFRLSELYEPIVEDGDTYIYDITITEENAMNFDTVQEFVEYKNDIEYELNANNELLLNGQFSTKAEISLGLRALININVKQNLKDESINQDYEITDVITSFTGFTLGGSWEQISLPSDYTVLGNVAIVTVEGILHYNLFAEGIGTVFSELKVFELKINIETGELISIIEI